MSVLNQYVAMIEESTYGTAAASARRGYESTVDGFSQEALYIDGGGRRAGRPGKSAVRRRRVNRGATGRIEAAVITRGEGLRLKHLIGSSAGPVVQASPDGDAYLQTFEANAGGPSGTYAVDASRSGTDGTLRYFRYFGAIPTGFSISIEEGGELMLAVDYDCLSETVVAAAPTAPTYPTGEMFVFEDVTVSVGGAAVSSFRSFELSGDLMMDTERYFVQGSAAKKIPLRNGIPTFEGSLVGEFGDLTEYNRFVNGDIVAIVVEATGQEVITTGGTVKPIFRLTLPACQYTGSTPESSLDDLTDISCPFEALSSSTNKICQIEYMSEDDAF